MVFAFLPTALVFFLAMFFFGAGIALLLGSSLFGAIAGLAAMLLSLAAELIAIKGSHKLYVASMNLLPVDYDKWLARQEKIAARSVGMKRLFVYCNILFGALSYEKAETAQEYLEILQPYAEKKKSPMAAFHFYGGMLSLREKLQDLSQADYLLAKMYEALNNPKFPGGGIQLMYVRRFEAARLEVEFYKRTPEELRTADRVIAEQMIASSRASQPLDGDISRSVGYRMLAGYYNAGLSCAVLGRQQEADAYFGRIAQSECRYPLVDRVRQYLEKRELSVLYAVIP